MAIRTTQNSWAVIPVGFIATLPRSFGTPLS